MTLMSAICHANPWEFKFDLWHEDTRVSSSTKGRSIAEYNKGFFGTLTSMLIICSFFAWTHWGLFDNLPRALRRSSCKCIIKGQTCINDVRWALHDYVKGHKGGIEHRSNKWMARVGFGRWTGIGRHRISSKRYLESATYVSYVTCYVCMLCMYVCLYVCMCVCVCVYVCMYVSVCVRVYF